MTLHTQTLPTTSAIDFCAFLSASFPDLRLNYYAFDEFVAPFSQVLTHFNGCVAAMDADSDSGSDFSGFASDGKKKWTCCRRFGPWQWCWFVGLGCQQRWLQWQWQRWRQRFDNVDVGCDGRCRRSVSSTAGWAGDIARTSGEASWLLPGYVRHVYVCSHGQADELVCHASPG